jgi:hypothetical protein
VSIALAEEAGQGLCLVRSMSLRLGSIRFAVAGLGSTRLVASAQGWIMQVPRSRTIQRGVKCPWRSRPQLFTTSRRREMSVIKKVGGSQRVELSRSRTSQMSVVSGPFAFDLKGMHRAAIEVRGQPVQWAARGAVGCLIDVHRSRYTEFAHSIPLTKLRFANLSPAAGVAQGQCKGRPHRPQAFNGTAIDNRAAISQHEIDAHPYIAVENSFGFGGTNGTLAFSRAV